jgi:hypothetical protein
MQLATGPPGHRAACGMLRRPPPAAARLPAAAAPASRRRRPIATARRAPRPPTSLPSTTTTTVVATTEEADPTPTLNTTTIPPPSDVTAAIPLPLDYYRALGVPRGSARDAIRRAYDRLTALSADPSAPAREPTSSSSSSQYYYSGQASAPPSLPRDLFSQDALFARAALLRKAVDTLTDLDARRSYDRRAVPASPLPGSTAAHASAVGPVVYSVDVSAADFPGALVLMQEAGGQASRVAALGEAWLRAHGASFPSEAADVAAAVALARCDLAAEALDAAEAAAGTVAGDRQDGGRGWGGFRVRPACEHLDAALALLRRAPGAGGVGGRAPQLQQQIAQALDDYAPRLSLELLALPLPGEEEEEEQEGGVEAAFGGEEEDDGGAAAPAATTAAAPNNTNAQLRQRGLELARRALWDAWSSPALQPSDDNGGYGGDAGYYSGGNEQGGGGGGGAREAFVAALRGVATAREQIALFSDLPPGARVSVSELLDTALAHVAEGFASRQPRLVARAAAIYEQVAAAAAASGSGPARALDVSVERAACALLLGDPAGAERLLGFGAGSAAAALADSVDPEVRAFVLAQSGAPVPSGGVGGNGPSSWGEAAAQAPEGLLPGLCALTEAWLQDAVLPRFRRDPAAEAQALAQAQAAAAATTTTQAADDASAADEAAFAAAARASSPLDAWFEAPWVRTYARVTYATRGVLQGGIARAIAAAVAAAVAFVRGVFGWLLSLVSSPFRALGGLGRRGGNDGAAAAAGAAAASAPTQQMRTEQAAEAELHSWGDAYYQGGGGEGGAAGGASAAPAAAPAFASSASAAAPLTEEEEDALLEFDRGALESESLTVEELRARLSGKDHAAAADAAQEEEEEEEAALATAAASAEAPPSPSSSSRPTPRPRPTARPLPPAPPTPPPAESLDVPAVALPAGAAAGEGEDEDLEASPFTGAAFRGKREAAAASLRALELDMWESRRDEAGGAQTLASKMLTGMVAAAAVAGAVAVARVTGLVGGGSAAAAAPAPVAKRAVVAPAAPAAVAAPAASSSSSQDASVEAPLTHRAAQRVVASWLEAKGKALGGAGNSGHRASAAANANATTDGLDSALTGKMLQKWRTLAREASAAGWCWRYRVRSVSVTDVSPAPGGGALVTAAIEEAGEVRRAAAGAGAGAGRQPAWTRFWRRGGGAEAQPADSYDARYVMRYTLTPAAEGGWRIADSAMVGDMVRV